MLFKKTKSPEPPKGPDAARREIYDVIQRHDLTRREAANLLQGIADVHRMSIATTTGLNTSPAIYTPKPPSPHKAALSALAGLIAGKAA